jgi:hypothetical protein
MHGELEYAKHPRATRKRRHRAALWGERTWTCHRPGFDAGCVEGRSGMSSASALAVSECLAG